MGSNAGSPDSPGDGLSSPEPGVIAWGGRRLDIRAWRLSAPAARDGAARMSLAADRVLERAQEASGPAGLRHLVVGVIGPRDACERQRDLARALGRSLGTLTLTTICGGRSGVMEAVCRGVDEVGGLSIGLLPGYGPEEANPFVGIPLPTGLSEGRNMVIARAARVLIAIGGSYGTLTEMAYGLHFGKTVIALDDAPDIAGLTRAADVPAAVALCCAALLRQAEAVPTAPTDAHAPS